MNRYLLFFVQLIFVLFICHTTPAFAISEFDFQMSAATTKQFIEVFHCTATCDPSVPGAECGEDADVLVKLKDKAQLISGFDPRDGRFECSVGKLNEIAFKAFHDPQKKYKGIPGFVDLKIQNDGYTITCADGQGVGPDGVTPRRLILGPFGK